MKFIEAAEIFQDEAARWGLPAWTYNSAELTQLEIEQVFQRIKGVLQMRSVS